MRFVTFAHNGAEQAGVLSADGSAVHSLRDWNAACPDLCAIIEHYTAEAAASVAAWRGKQPAIPLAEVKLLAPLPRPRHDIICVGLNYVEHIREGAAARGWDFKLPELPVFFSKRVGVATGPDSPVPAHADITAKLDYEAELAVIIGKRCDHVRPEDAYGHVFGYTIVNDISARDLQSGHVQFYFGKSLDGFSPMGPWIVTADEVAAPDKLRVVSRVNGETRQNGCTSDFIFDIPRLIATLSAGIVLEPGDIIATGTPSGVGMGMTPPGYLSPGDVVECEVEGIGILRNPVV